MEYGSILKDAQVCLEKSRNSMKHYFLSHISLRIQPEVLSKVCIEYNNAVLNINQVAQITVDNQTTLSIKPWDSKLLSKIEKALIESNSLKLNISTAANNTIYVKLPTTTKERRQELIKLAKQQGEQVKIAIRNIRQDFKQIIKNLVKDANLSKEDEKLLDSGLQNLVNKFTNDVDKLVKIKQEELEQI